MKFSAPLLEGRLVRRYQRFLADAIDPVYGKTLREALARGVEAMAWWATVSPQEIMLRDPLPVFCP